MSFFILNSSYLIINLLLWSKCKTREKFFIQLSCNSTDEIPKSFIITNIFTNGCASKIKFHWYLFFCLFWATCYLLTISKYSCVWLLIFVVLKAIPTQIHSLLVVGTEPYCFLLKINLLLKSAYIEEIRELTSSYTTLSFNVRYYYIYLSYS